jgi:hypothetical protein
MLPEHKDRSISDIETDLINCLLSSPTIDYPWNPTDPDTAEYYTRADLQFGGEIWSDDELYNRSRSLSMWRQYSRLDAL